jgi:DNA-directed RNA polymerase alpha subunit
MSKTIRIDDDIWDVLKSQAVPLEDTPSSVLRRVFLKAGLLSQDQAENQRIEALKGSVHKHFSGLTCKGLDLAGIKTLGDLLQKTEDQLTKLKWFGRKSLKEINDTLAKMGLRLGSEKL